MRFEFATAARLIFGPGSWREAAPLAAEISRRALVVTGSRPDRAEPLLDSLKAVGVAGIIYSVAGEPTTDQVRLGTQRAREEQCGLVIAFGGGSAIDAGKAIAGLMTNPGEPLDYLEGVGKGQPLVHPGAPMIAIPTTAGTGAEVTRNAVLGSPEHRVKVSLRSLWLLPRLAMVDPTLTHGLPPDLTASTGLDALTQLIEPFVSSRANPMVDSLCREGMRRVARSLRRAFAHGDDADAREDMSLASLFGGLALANAGLGAVHGFAGPVGGMFPAPHGTVCGALLPHVMAVNIRALQDRAPDHPALQKYQEIARILTNQPGAVARDGVAWVQELWQFICLPSLAHFGVTTMAAPLLVEKASKASSMKSNPIVLTTDELSEILGRALE